VRNNLGGHVNSHHVLAGHGTEWRQAAGEVLAAIDRDFGGMEKHFQAVGVEISS